MPGNRPPKRPDYQARRSAVVDELDGEVEVLALDQGLDGLQVVAALAGHAEFLALDLGLDALRALVADQLGQLLRVLLGDTGAGRGVDLRSCRTASDRRPPDWQIWRPASLSRASGTALTALSVFLQVSHLADGDPGVRSSKSEHWLISFAAWITALSTSDGRPCSQCRRRTRSHGQFLSDLLSGHPLRIVSTPVRSRHPGGLPGGQRGRL